MEIRRIVAAGQLPAFTFLSRKRFPRQILRIKSHILVSDHLLKPRIRIGGAIETGGQGPSQGASLLSCLTLESGQEAALEKARSEWKAVKNHII